MLVDFKTPKIIRHELAGKTLELHCPPFCICCKLFFNKSILSHVTTSHMFMITLNPYCDNIIELIVLQDAGLCGKIIGLQDIK